MGILFISSLVNILYLTASMFMLEVYDRVLPSRSVPTLLVLGLLALFLYLFQGMLDFTRQRACVILSYAFDASIGQSVFSSMLKLSLARDALGAIQPPGDLDQIRTFIGSGAPMSFLDLPWIPIYLAVCFGFHPYIGLSALGGAVLLTILSVTAEIRTRKLAKDASAYMARRNRVAENARRNVEVAQAMGFSERLFIQWQSYNSRFVELSGKASDVSLLFGTTSKTVRMILQSFVLAVAALLVIREQASGGVMIASSILVARALAPVEISIAHWKGLISARQSWQRLRDLVVSAKPPLLELPTPCSSLGVESLSVRAPGDDKLINREVNFALSAGEFLGVIGASGSGKSTLARAIVGLWPAARGMVRLDGISILNWSERQRGRHIGYLPQDVQLFPGTIADNIARFEEGADANDVIAAARKAGVHDLIAKLPGAYNTVLDDMGGPLSAGQRQRVALARALYRDPFLVVLDEPNSNLDFEGEQALTAAVFGIRERGGIAVVIAHRPNTVAGADKILVMEDGAVRAFGQREAILAAVLKSRPAISPARAS